MTTLTYDQLYTLARQQGLSSQASNIAAAVALGESGGLTTNYNPRPPDLSYGLWQINMINRLGPARRADFNLGRNEELFDPVVNARAMASISNGGTNWQPWTVYTKGIYKKHLRQGKEVPLPADLSGGHGTFSSLSDSAGIMPNSGDSATGEEFVNVPPSLLDSPSPRLNLLQTPFGDLSIPLRGIWFVSGGVCLIVGAGIVLTGSATGGITKALSALQKLK